jgi:carbon storage regulator
LDFTSQELHRLNSIFGDVEEIKLWQVNEQIVIAENIVITVVEIRGGKVRLGIEAPKSVPVHRKEVYEAIQRGKEQKPNQASARDPADVKPTD